ncbi:hypothetical protein LZG04_15005 [Saccharothrix sp. S26]|uniref:hypothetical protein n=1 Tax=Saccharothrix sp. S26 TaxID=2907215 RepID=UPI001F220FCF|nr:hypothetical protein [Saccharothrix sp. S26]MCE6996101.1 hypothetical protein [Saccharothrix sp. S26]
MSTPTETRNDYSEETVESVQQDGTTTTVTPDTEPDQREQHKHHDGHTLEDGELSPLCAGGGCPDGTVK